ncbi:MAG: aminopeptidase P family protein [Myxococcota bacterium]
MASLLPTGFDAAATARRRELLAASAGGRALIASGRAPARNYAGNTHPFRASSHFLYLVGAPLEGAVLSIGEGDPGTLYAPTPAEDDALWHGETPGPAELEASLGLPVRPLAELERGDTALPVFDPGTMTRLETLLRRRPTLEHVRDAGLADALIALRLRHDAHARAELRRAAKATVIAHLAGMAATHPGVPEHAIRAAMLHAFEARGMTTAYGPIVTVHGEVLHQRASEGIARAGDLLLADVGAETAGGWAGDVTRTWPVSGSFSATQRDVYLAVLAAQRAAIAKVAPGVRYRDVHLAASHALTEGLVALGILVGDPEELVADGVHALFFPHGVGHLLGLDVHDMEDLGDRAGYAPGRERSRQFGLSYLRLDRDLEAHMAVTIEPGFYQVPAILEDPAQRAWVKGRVDWARLAAFADVRGIRIEDDVLVTETGAEVLTGALPKDPDALPVG